MSDSLIMSADRRLKELGYELPAPPKALAVYMSAITIGNICYTAGHLPVKSDGTLFLGCVGRDIDQQTGFDAARQSGLALLATLRAHLGSLDRVKQVIKLFGMVNCSQEFTQQPAVINGCSELMAQIFGPDVGVGCRSAIGVNALPLGVAVEIEGIFELHPS